MTMESKKLTNMHAWMFKHDSHGLCLDDLFFLPEGVKPDPHRVMSHAVRVPWLDGVLTGED